VTLLELESDPYPDWGGGPTRPVTRCSTRRDFRVDVRVFRRLLRGGGKNSPWGVGRRHLVGRQLEGQQPGGWVTPLCVPKKSHDRLWYNEFVDDPGGDATRVRGTDSPKDEVTEGPGRLEGPGWIASRVVGGGVGGNRQSTVDRVREAGGGREPSRVQFLAESKAVQTGGGLRAGRIASSKSRRGLCHGRARASANQTRKSKRALRAAPPIMNSGGCGPLDGLGVPRTLPIEPDVNAGETIKSKPYPNGRWSSCSHN